LFGGKSAPCCIIAAKQLIHLLNDPACSDDLEKREPAQESLQNDLDPPVAGRRARQTQRPLRRQVAPPPLVATSMILFSAGQKKEDKAIPV